MIDATLRDKIVELSKNKNTAAIEPLLKAALQKDPNNTDLLMQLAVLGQTVPLKDYLQGVACLEKVIKLEPDNVNALLILAYIFYHCLGGISDDLMKKLSSVKTKTPEEASMIQYALSWYYSDIEEEELEQKALEKSIALCPTHAFHYIHLASLYEEQGRKKAAEDLKKRGLENLKTFTPKNGVANATDPQAFINECIKGTV